MPISHHGIGDCASEIMNKEGISGFYKGIQVHLKYLGPLLFYSGVCSLGAYAFVTIVSIRKMNDNFTYQLRIIYSLYFCHRSIEVARQVISTGKLRMEQIERQFVVCSCSVDGIQSHSRKWQAHTCSI